MANRPTITVQTITSLRALKDTIIVHGMDFNERLSQGGIIMLDDDMKSAGIRPRWAQIYALGSNVDYLKVGQYIMISHGRWSRGQAIEDETGEKVIRKVDPKDVLLVSDNKVDDFTHGIEN